jgi:hypothetical protein
MGLVSQSVKNLKGGISQQPDILRYSSQGAVQINAWSSEAEGLQKRPPASFVKHLGAEGIWGAKPLVHLINRDKVEQYLAVFTGSGISVVDLLGNSYSVSGDTSYANCANPREDLRMVTVADYTFVVNRKKVVTVGGTFSHAGHVSPLSRNALINVRGGQYGRTLTVDVNGTRGATLVMPDGSVAAHVTQTDAQWIAGQLASQLQSNLGGWAVVAGSGWVSIQAPAGQLVSNITTSDGFANQLINAFTYQVQTFNKLPAQAPDDYIVEITGESASSGDNYWVQYQAESHVWRETVKPAILDSINVNTMPHSLIRLANGNFEFRPVTWGKKSAGDEVTNPFPSFVDSTINDVFFFRNRLGFLTGENAVMSRSAKYFDFFPASVATLSDDDPIDVAISHNRVSVLKYAVPFSEQLLLWSDQAQFVLSSDGILSSKNIQLDLTTEFDVSDDARPFGIGRGVYFVSPRASYSSVKRYYAVQDVSAVKSAEDISAHIPNYIPNTVFALHGSGTENFLAVLSDGAPSCVFIYKFLYQEEQVVQQSWSHWEFGEDSTVLSAVCIGSFMWVVIKRAGGITLERLQFTLDTVDYVHEPFRAYMDMKTPAQSALYEDDEFRSLIRLKDLYGFTPTYGNFYVVGGDGNVTLFNEPVGGWVGDGDLWLNGDTSGQWFTVGRQFGFTYGFSKFLIKQTGDDGSTTTEDIGRLQLRRAWVNYQDSGAFDIAVDNGSTQFNYTMAGGRMGINKWVGQLSLGAGQFKYPISGNALNQEVFIFSSAPTPLSIIGCGWEGNYLRRSSGL